MTQPSAPRAAIVKHRGAHAPTVVLVDPQPIVRDGLTYRTTDAGFAVVAAAGNRREAQEMVARHRPDLAVVDIVLDLEDGLELVGWIHDHHKATRVLVFSQRDPLFYGERALRAGALGYVGKLEPVNELLRAMHAVLAGHMHTPRALAEKLARGMRGGVHADCSGLLDLLTDRELQVFELLGSGRASQQIASALDVSIKTIATHRTHIQRKLGITSLGELTRCAVIWVEQHRPHDVARVVTGAPPREGPMSSAPGR